MPLLPPAPSRTATFSGTSRGGVFVGPSDQNEILQVSCPGGTAIIQGQQITADFEQDLVYGTQDGSGNPTTWSAGASQRWRARIHGGCTYQASGPAGTLSSTSNNDLQVGAWIIYHFPFTPSVDTSMYPNYGTILDTVAQASEADFSGSLTLAHLWTTSGPLALSEQITAATLTVNFSATASATLYYFGDSNVQQTLPYSYSFSTTYSASSSPNTVLSSYTCSVAAVTYSSWSWTLSWSLPGCTYSPGSASLADTHNRFGTVVGTHTNGTGTTSATGTVFSGSVTNTTHAGTPTFSGGWSSASWAVAPDQCWGADATLKRYRDGGGIAGSPLTWTAAYSDPGITVNTDGAGSATGFVYPYDGSTLTAHFYQINVNGPSDGAAGLSIASPSAMLMRMDPSWADGAGYFLKANSLGQKADQLQGKIARRFHIGTLQLDDSHSFGFFGSSNVSLWSTVSGTGAISFDSGLSALKYAPSSWPYRVTTNDAAKKLQCAFYRYYKVRVRSDQAGAQIKFGVGARGGGSAAPFTYYYWTITVNAANTWEDHVIDLALPESDSLGTSPVNFINPPANWFTNPWGAFDLTFLTSGANYWIQSFTGFLNQTGNRIPSLLAGSLNGFPSQPLTYGDYFHKGSTTGDGGTGVEPDWGTKGDFSRIGIAAGVCFGRMYVNGVNAADFREISSYGLSAGIPATCRGFWTGLQSKWDDAANDTGLHVACTNDPLGLFDDYATSFERNGALWSRLNDTPGTPATHDVYCEPFGPWVVAFPGAGDWYNGSYGTRIVNHYHHYLEGEMMGLLAKRAPIRNQTITFYRLTDPGGTVVGTATSDDDGFWRWFAPYGVDRPYSNNPGSAGTSGSPDWLKQFTAPAGGFPTAWNSTALARRFQGYIAQCKAFHDRDGSNYALNPGVSTRQIFYCYDRWTTYFGFGDAIPPETGLDLIRSPVNWLYRSYVKQSPVGVNVGRLIYGQSWVDVQVATDQDGAAVPTLFVHPGGALGLLYHDTSGRGRMWWSVDLGATWQDRATWSNVGTYPRGVLLTDRRLLIISYTGSGLTLHVSDDWMSTTPPTLTSAATVGGVPEQLAALRVDRHGFVHRIHADSTPQLLHSYTADPANWSTPTVLAAGDHPAYGVGIERGIYARWPGSGLAIETTTETYDAASALPAFDLSALPAFGTQYLGLLWDAWETVVLAGIDPSSGDPVTYYSPERHTFTSL